MIVTTQQEIGMKGDKSERLLELLDVKIKPENNV